MSDAVCTGRVMSAVCMERESCPLYAWEESHVHCMHGERVMFAEARRGSPPVCVERDHRRYVIAAVRCVRLSPA